MRTLHRHQVELRAAIVELAFAPFASAIVPARLSPREQLDIYRHHYVLTLTEALRVTFPVILQLVGEACFRAMAARFIERHPPVAPVLFEYGDRFADFVDDRSELSGGLPYLADVARLEWAINLAYSADDAETIGLAELVALSGDSSSGALLGLHPSVQLVGSPYPIDLIWRANQPGADPAATVNLDRGGARIVVYRDAELDAAWRSLTLGEDAFFRMLNRGATLDEAHQAAAVHGSFELGSTLSWSLNAGLFVKLPATANPQRSFPP